MTLGCCTKNEAEHQKKAKTEARGGKNYGQPHPCCLCPHQIMGLRVTKVQYKLPHKGHQGPIDLEAPGIHTAADDATGNLEAI